MKKGTLKIVIGSFLFLGALANILGEPPDTSSVIIFWLCVGVVLMGWGYRQRQESLEYAIKPPPLKPMSLRESFRAAQEQLADQESARKRLAQYRLESPDIIRIIEESIGIICQTKNLQTALVRFDTIRENFTRLLEIAPATETIEIRIPGLIDKRRITSLEDLACINDAKKTYTREFHKKKIDMELLKANSLTDNKLKNSQLKKAMNAALSALEELPEDESIHQRIANIETQIAQI